MIVQKYLIVIYACVLSIVWHYTLGLLLIVHCGIVASSDDWTTGLKVVLTPHTCLPAFLYKSKYFLWLLYRFFLRCED